MKKLKFSQIASEGGSTGMHLVMLDEHRHMWDAIYNFGRYRLRRVEGSNKWRQIGCGENYSAAIREDGTLWVRHFIGYTRRDKLTFFMDFMPIENASDCAQLACGEAHIAVIKTDGTLWGYGESGYGQLAGIGTKKKLVPMDKGQWIQVSCGKWHTVALKADGTLWGVGCNYHSQIGRIEGPGGLGDRTTLTQIEKDNDWVQVACGSNHTLAIKSDGTMWGVGLVDPVRTGCLKTFTQLGASRDWLRVACRHSRIVEYRKDGTVKLDGRILSDEIPGGISQVALCLTSAAVLNSQGNLYVYPMYKFDNHE